MSVTQTEVKDLLCSMYPFRSMTPRELEQLAGSFKVVSLPKGQTLYQINDPAIRLYLCFSGNIELQRLSDSNQTERFGVIDTCEFFGLETMLGNQAYLTQASALNQSVLLAVEQDELFNLLETFPLLHDFLSTLHKSYYPLLGMRLSWRQNDELVFWSSRKHPIFLWVHMLIPILVAVILLTLYLLLMISEIVNPVSLSVIFGVVIIGIALPMVYIYIEWTDDFFVITDRRVISRNRVILLYETKEETSLDAIQSVSKKIHSVWGAVVGYGDVTIRTFTGFIIFDKIPNPDIISDFIEDVRSRRKRLHNVMDREEKMGEMRRRLGYANQTSSLNKPSAEEAPLPADLAEGGFFSAFNSTLQALFRLRSVTGDEVTYRTHWIILIKQTGLSFLIFLACLIYIITMIIRASFLELLALPIFFEAVFMIVGVAALLVTIYQYIDWRNDRYIVNNRQVVDLDQKPLGREDRRQAPLSAIQSVEYKRIGFFGLLLNFGTVFIRVGDTQLTFDYVANPSGVQQEISHRIEIARERERQAEIRREREAILDWIDVYHALTHPPNELPIDGMQPIPPPTP